MPIPRNSLTPQNVLPTHLQLFYGGGWHEPAAGAYADTLNPGNGTVVARVAQAGADDVDAAVKAAQAAFPAWRKTKPAERGALLRQAADVLRAHAEELAMLDAVNTGNPVAEMVGDARVAAATIDYFAGLAQETKGTTVPMGDSQLNYSVREPLGVVARIVAYNHPLLFAGMKLGAPLAAGNTIVIKAPDQAPLSSLRMAELLAPIFPPGVVNILAGGRDCGQALSSHPLVKKVTLIGSVATGKAIMRTAAETLKGVVLELGGKNALIVYPDADLEKAAVGIVRGMNFTWAGQSCGSTSRVFLHALVHDRVLSRVVALLGERHRPGVPTDWSTTMGPLISRDHYHKVLRYINIGLGEGATLATGGKPCTDPALAGGFFIEPTIFADVKSTMRIAREEIFGPVLSVLKWSDEDTMFDEVNDSDLGLTASIWTRDLVTAHRAAARVEAGFVWINQGSMHFLGAPFGGYKQSGLGREECIEELLEFTQLKNVNVLLDA